MKILEFYESLNDYLALKARVVRKVQNKIDVGEEFTLRVTVQNISRNWYPFIKFKNVSIHVGRGRHARPKVNNGLFRIDSYLDAGESQSRDFVMVATAELNYWDDIWDAEELATITAWGDLDYERFFRVRNTKKVKIDF